MTQKTMQSGSLPQDERLAVVPKNTSRRRRTRALPTGSRDRTFERVEIGRSDQGPAHPPVSLDKFLAEMGLSPVSGWRFRNRGWIKTVNIAGRHYVPHESIIEFNERAARGEFSRRFANPKDNEAKARDKHAGRRRKLPKSPHE